MIFRQMLDYDSFTYTYLIGDKDSQEAVLIDPVKERCAADLTLLKELDLKLVAVFDTHVHADHITGAAKLRQESDCEIFMGAPSKAQGITRHLKDGEVFSWGNLSLTAMATPGHTDDSFSYLMEDRVFTGDALFIRGTGRTDFQHGSNEEAYHSLFKKLLTLADDTFVYPGHDYKGQTVSTIGEEKRFNPRLQVTSVNEYAKIMDALNLPKPKRLDEAVPANLSACGGV
ncbi:MAG: MBL fold metallo-hydrolase [bacterium]|nr:MBL fold metallo-hydrolase [bacterium]